PNVTVIPNGYERPAFAAGHRRVASPPTLRFQGQMTYEPNVDGASYLVTRVLPLVRREIPDVALRIVGRCDDTLLELRKHRNVTVTGYVPHIETELGAADAVVVPVRFGSGTRIKILEAFAHRVPVASTTLGAEGLGVASERELLVGDDAQSLASAC